MRRLAAMRKKAAPKRIDNAAKLCYDKQNAVTGRVRPAPQAERGRSVQVLVRQGSGRSSLSVARQSGPRAGQGTGRAASSGRRHPAVIGNRKRFFSGRVRGLVPRRRVVTRSVLIAPDGSAPSGAFLLFRAGPPRSAAHKRR